jgi:hypothetical protein
MTGNRLEKLASGTDAGEGILSLTLAPNGLRRYDQLLDSLEFLRECGMDQLILLAGEPNALKMAEITRAEAWLMNQEQVQLGSSDMFFDSVEAIRERFEDLPLVANPMAGDIVCYGQGRFVQRCVEVGVDGVDCAYYQSVTDPFGLRSELISAGVHFLGAVYASALDLKDPVHRKLVEQVVALSRGQLLFVSGVAGEQRQIDGSRFVETMAYIRSVQRARGIDARIVAVGGINSPEDARQMTQVAGADGIHLASALIKKKRGGATRDEIATWLRELKAAMRS